MNKTLAIGSISHGTMLDTDLVPAFYDALYAVDKREACKIKRNYSKAFRKLAGVNVRDYSDEQYNEDLTYLVNETLFDALSNYTPEYFYFGSHEGDGSDYGVWIDSESIQNDIHDGIIYEVEDLSEVDDMVREEGRVPKRVILTNDHGNMAYFVITTELVEHDNYVEMIWTTQEVWSIV